MRTSTSLQRLLAVLAAAAILWPATDAAAFPVLPADLTTDTARDARTNLTWQRGFTPNVTWGQALNTCEALTLGGQSDWRVPTAKELSTIVEEFLPPAPAAIDQTVFPATPAENFHTATPSSATGGPAVYVVDFATGRLITVGPATTGNVRCVRGG